MYVVTLASTLVFPFSAVLSQWFCLHFSWLRNLRAGCDDATADQLTTPQRRPTDDGQENGGGGGGGQLKHHHQHLFDDPQNAASVDPAVVPLCAVHVDRRHSSHAGLPRPAAESDLDTNST